MNPTRTIIIAGFCNAEALDTYRSSVFNHEKMIEHYSLPTPHMLFLIFYDLRESIKFYSSFRSEELNISYTISKYEFPKKNEECTEKNLQSTVVFTFKGIDVKIDDSFITGFLKQYGEVKALKATKPYQKIIEFYDIRSARKAFSVLNGSPFGTGDVHCGWEWDIPASVRVDYLKQADEFIRMYSGGDEVPPPKKIRVDGICDGTSRKNMFIALFDKFIVNNIMDIERMFR